MKLHFSYHSKLKTAEEYKQILEDYATDKKLSGLSRLLQHGNYELADFDVRVEPLAHRSGLLIKMDLEVKKHVLHAESEGYNPIEVFDLALEKIIIQLRKVESVRHDK